MATLRQLEREQSAATLLDLKQRVDRCSLDGLVAPGDDDAAAVVELKLVAGLHVASVSDDAELVAGEGVGR